MIFQEPRCGGCIAHVSVEAADPTAPDCIRSATDLCNSLNMLQKVVSLVSSRAALVCGRKNGE